MAVGSNPLEVDYSLEVEEQVSLWQRMIGLLQLHIWLSSMPFLQPQTTLLVLELQRAQGVSESIESLVGQAVLGNILATGCNREPEGLQQQRPGLRICGVEVLFRSVRSRVEEMEIVGAGQRTEQGAVLHRMLKEAVAHTMVC